MLVKKQFDSVLSVDVLTGEHSRGEQEIGARYKRQLAAVQALAGAVPAGLPTLIGEFGIPYDLNDGAAYAAWVSGQHDDSIWQTHIQALSLMYDALDALQLSSTQWNYTASNLNNARVGDQWNQEDLSVYSLDQPAGRAVKGFCRPCAQAVQRSLQQMFFCMASGVFELQYIADQAATEPTQIYLPKVQYPHGVTITFEGAVQRREHREDQQLLLVWATAPGIISIQCKHRA